MLLSFPALAQQAAAPVVGVTVADSGDTAWILSVSLLMVITLLPGALLRFAGWSMPVLIDAAGRAMAAIGLVSLGWVANGYSLAFSDGTPILGGIDNLWLANLAELRVDTTIPESSFTFYQLGLALLAVMLVVVQAVDRARFAWSLTLAALWGLCVYVPVAHWLWGNGWLSNLGAHDFAGGIVVNVATAAAALVIRLMIKPNNAAEPPENTTVASTGLFGGALIWVGWLAVIGGAALTASDDASAAIINAQVSAAASALVWGLLAQLHDKAATVRSMMDGALAGLGAAAASAAYIGPAGAAALGGLAGAIGFLSATLSAGATGRNQSDVISVIGVPAIVGAVLFPLFVPIIGGPGFEQGVTLAGQIGAQATAVGAVVGWSALVTLVMGLGITLIIPMRATEV